MAENDQPFVWCRMTDQGREHLEAILARKEAERLTGGAFWWGMGTKLKVQELAVNHGGSLPVQFSAAWKDEEAGPHHLWTHLEDADGQQREIPPHVLVVGPLRKSDKKFALICESDQPLCLRNHLFDMGQHQNYPSESQVAGQQSAAILARRRHQDFSDGKEYQEGFSASLLKPWQVKLVHPPRMLTEKEWNRLNQWRPGDDWLSLVHSIRN